MSASRQAGSLSPPPSVNDIVQLQPADFDEALDLLNLAFGFKAPPDDFESILPKLYQPNRMGWNYAIRTREGLRAIVGVFPMTFHVGSTRLKVGGIGGVGTHPDARGEGHMSRLMNYCLGTMKREGFDLSCLGGLRQRYAKFGYETGGVRHNFQVLRQNIQRVPEADRPVRFCPLANENAEALATVQELHDRSPVRVDRPMQDFQVICRSWDNWAYAAHDQENRVAGYLVADKTGALILELHARDTTSALAMVRSWMDEHCIDDLRILAKPSDRELVHALGNCAQEHLITHSYSWNIFNWPRTVNAFLQLYTGKEPCPAGSCVVEVEDVSRLRLSVTEESAACRETSQPASIHCTKRQAIRLLFGPAAPDSLMTLPQAAGILRAWCPLPLGWSSVDAV